MDCIFCKIVKGEIPADVVYQDEQIMCFRDLSPQAPVHVLIIPKAHIASLDDLTATSEEKFLLGHLLGKVKDLAEKLGLENGYRLICNRGSDGQQTVGHLHFHLLGGRQLEWPPG